MIWKSKKKERLITGYKIVYTNEAPLKDTNTHWDKTASSVYFAKKEKRGQERREERNTTERSWTCEAANRK